MNGRRAACRAIVLTLAVSAAAAGTTGLAHAQTVGPVEWTNLINATATGSEIRKTSGCSGCPDAGGTSTRAIVEGDGAAEFIPVLGARLYAGLTSTLTASTDPKLIDFSFSFWPDGGWDIRERNDYQKEGRFAPGDVFRVALSGGLVQYFQNGVLVYTSTAPVTRPLVLNATLVDAGAALASATIAALPPPTSPSPVAISTTTLRDGALNATYLASLAATGGSGTYRWTLAAGALPTGLTVSEAGVIAGTPAAAGSYSFTIRAADIADAANSDDQALRIDVVATQQAVSVLTTTVAPARAGEPYSAALSATGGTGALVWTIASGALPAGLTLDAGGLIRGTAAETGRYNVTVRATDTADATNRDDQPLALAVVAATPPTVYDAISDRTTRTKGTLPQLGPAGHTFTDPIFGTQLMRVTDGTTRPAAPDRSYRTPSATHSNAWSADARHFYVTSTDGTAVPFAFDPATMRATRLPSTADDGGLTLRFFNEPTFSYITPGVLYGTYSGGNLRSVDQYDIYTGIYSQLINLDTLAPNLAGTYTGGLAASAGSVEKVFAFFGGTSQDRHVYLVVFEKGNPSNRLLVDTLASTVDGVPTNVALNFKIHAAAIDRSGRYVTIYPTATDQQAPRSAAPAYVWDTVTNTFTATPLVATRAGGHDAYGYGYRVNQDCCTSSTWDAGQWQLRSLATPSITSDLIAPVLQPKEVFLADHPSWHNAQPIAMVPFVDATYRYGTNTAPWRAWDDEIIAVQTEAAGTGATVWRFAHHRSAVANDSDPSRISFWYTPRANVSPDGRWALFTSNWEKTLGTDPRGEPGGMFRQDVFVAELKRTAAPSRVVIATTALPPGTVGQPYSATLQASGGSGTFTWSIVSGALPSGLSLDAATGTIVGTPGVAQAATFTVRAADATDPANSGQQALTIAVAAPPVVPVTIATTTLPNGLEGQVYSATLQASGGTGTFLWSVVAGTLPAGLSLNASTGVISGTPSASGTVTFTARATDAGSPSNFADRSLSLTVAARPTSPVTITTTILPEGKRDVFYTATFAFSGGRAPLVWSISAGSLPPGLALDAATGTIAGTPRDHGTWSVTIRVVDSASPATSDTQAVSLRVRRR